MSENSALLHMSALSNMSENSQYWTVATGVGPQLDPSNDKG